MILIVLRPLVFAAVPGLHAHWINYSIIFATPPLLFICSFKCSYSLQSYDTCDKSSSKNLSFLAAVQTKVEPTHFSDAIKHEKWQTTMQHEINALQSKGPWTLTKLPYIKKDRGCKRVYRIKHYP